MVWHYNIHDSMPKKHISNMIKHAVSDTFIIIICERAPLEMTYIFISSKVICEENCEGAKRPSRSAPSQGRENLQLEPEKREFLMHIWGKGD